MNDSDMHALFKLVWYGIGSYVAEYTRQTYNDNFIGF